MGNRDTGSLYSGLTPPVRREQVAKQEETAKPDARAEMVLDEIAKLKAEAMNINQIVLDDTVDNEVKLKTLERMRERYNDLNTLEVRMQKLLGVKPKRGRQ